MQNELLFTGHFSKEEENEEEEDDEEGNDY